MCHKLTLQKTFEMTFHEVPSSKAYSKFFLWRYNFNEWTYRFISICFLLSDNFTRSNKILCSMMQEEQGRIIVTRLFVLRWWQYETFWSLCHVSGWGSEARDNPELLLVADNSPSPDAWFWLVHWVSWPSD